MPNRQIIITANKPRTYTVWRGCEFMRIMTMTFSSVLFVVIFCWTNGSRVPYLWKQVESLHQWYCQWEWHNFHNLFTKINFWQWYFKVNTQGCSQEFQKGVSNDRMNITQWSGLTAPDADKSYMHACFKITWTLTYFEQSAIVVHS